MNEITPSLFTIMVMVQLVASGWVIFRVMEPQVIDILVALFASIFGYVNAQMMLNGNVAYIVADTTTTTYVPIQSIPMHYLLLTIAAIMTILTLYISVMVIKEAFSQKNSSVMKNWMEET